MATDTRRPTAIGEINDDERRALLKLEAQRLVGKPGNFTVGIQIGPDGEVAEEAFAALRKLLPEASTSILKFGQEGNILTLTHGRGSVNSTGFDTRVWRALTEAVRPKYHGQGQVHVSLVRDGTSAGVLVTCGAATGQLAEISSISSLMAQPGVSAALKQLAEALVAGYKLETKGGIQPESEVLSLPQVRQPPAA